MAERGFKKIIECAADLMKTSGRDLFVFSGVIDDANCDRFITEVLAHKNRRSSATLFLCTYGGDPHAAYRMARVLRRCYPQNIRILIPSQCKSAGTLIALCADSLGFSDFGELGPLDTQLSRPDEVMQRASGLEVFSTLQYLTDHAFACFEQNMLTIISQSGQTVSTRLASEIASRLATGLLKPITAQLDPYRIGIAQRGLEVTKVYGRQIANVKNLKSNADAIVEHLVKDYPTHAFVIDREEAAEMLFNTVTGLTNEEQSVFIELQSALVRPAEKPLIAAFAPIVEAEVSKDKQENKNGKPQRSDRATSPSGKQKPVKPASRRKANGRYIAASSEGESAQAAPQALQELVSSRSR